MGTDPAAKGSAMQTGEAVKTAGLPVAMYSFLTVGPSRGPAAGNRWLRYLQPRPSTWQ